MSEVALSDFSETLSRTDIEPTDIERVLACWGYSPEGYGSWEGAFVLRTKDGKYAYVWGWCDSSGWGCQDGAEVVLSDDDPGREVMRGRNMSFTGLLEQVFGKPSEAWSQEWDEDPIDLNRWIAAGAPDVWEWERKGGAA